MITLGLWSWNFSISYLIQYFLMLRCPRDRNVEHFYAMASLMQCHSPLQIHRDNILHKLVEKCVHRIFIMIKFVSNNHTRIFFDFCIPNEKCEDIDL